MANTKGKRRRFGAVRKLPSGRFQARYQGPDVLLRSAPETFPSQTDADRWLVRKEAEILDGRWQNPDEKIVFGIYASAWFKERDYAATTRERNGSALRLHILPTFGHAVLSEITTPQIRRWRADLLEAGVGEPTVAKAYQILRAIMNTAVDDGVIQRNPCRIKGAGTAKTAERPFLEVMEVFQLAEAVPGRFRVLILLAAFTGLRFGELAALQRRDIDLKAEATPGVQPFGIGKSLAIEGLFSLKTPSVCPRPDRGSLHADASTQPSRLPCRCRRPRRCRPDRAGRGSRRLRR
ncbi:hypothetical protein ABZ208_19200 [Streptomyces sp. NPDC006208]|uniref:tyrosine-type recombinase/integrase n=1 Tax=Streptomyces sp. NPDC006208 TaxID=3156734 RepID=UPI0033A8783E